MPFPFILGFFLFVSRHYSPYSFSLQSLDFGQELLQVGFCVCESFPTSDKTCSSCTMYVSGHNSQSFLEELWILSTSFLKTKTGARAVLIFIKGTHFF